MPIAGDTDSVAGDMKVDISSADIKERMDIADLFIKAKYLKAEDTLIPYSDGRKLSLAATTIVHKSGKQIPLMECGATYEDYLDGLNEEAIQQVTEKASDAGNFPGLKIGDITKDNDNASNW